MYIIFLIIFAVSSRFLYFRIEKTHESKCDHYSNDIPQNQFSFTSPKSDQTIYTWTNICEKCNKNVFFTKGYVDGEPDHIISIKL